MDPAQFAELRKHLVQLDEPVCRFCRKHGFSEQTEESSLGRYPRRRLVRYGSINLFIDLQMELRTDGQYYERFSPDIPYSLAAGAWTDVGATRWSKSVLGVQGLPFIALMKTIEARLDEAYEIIARWDLGYLKREGRITTLQRRDV